MSFAWPHLLWLLLAPAALLGWELTHRRRIAAADHPKILRAEAGARSLELADFKSAHAPSTARARAWLCAGLALAVVALARPQWGQLEEPVFDQSREILLALDLSRSMLAPDVKPARLDRAKLLVTSLLEKLTGERVGLVVFSGTAFLQSPLSSDYEILREFLPALGPDFLPEGGTNYRALLDTSIQAFGSTAAADRFLIILSDGEATDDDWRGRTDDLKKKGIRVIGLGVGTAAGAMIPDGAGGLVKDERGAVVLSKLESGTLQELARATGGAYRDASTWLDLAALVKETVEAGRKGKFLEKNTVRLVERFQWPLALGLWCLLVSFCYEFPVRPRPRAIQLAPAGVRSQESGVKKTTLATATLVLFWLLAPGSWLLSAARAVEASAPPPSPLSKIVGRLSAAATRSARDWAEFGRETVTWGSRLESEQQPVPEGPVRDALSAVDLGSKLDAKTADWPKLREELEALLQKKDEDKKDQQQQQQDKNQQRQNQDQQNQQNQSQQQQSDSKQQQNQQDSQPQKQDSPKNQDTKPNDPQKKSDESAFGDMKKQEQPPPPPQPSSETQKVGGNPEEKKERAEPVDPSLVLPLQKLEQLRNQDSPARLFQLMEGEKKNTDKKPAKDW